MANPVPTAPEVQEARLVCPPVDRLPFGPIACGVHQDRKATLVIREVQATRDQRVQSVNQGAMETQETRDQQVQPAQLVKRRRKADLARKARLALTPKMDRKDQPDQQAPPDQRKCT